MKRVMSIAGSDSGGGAGIQADLKAFLRCGVYGTTAITSVTAQNTREVAAVHDLPPEMVVSQIEAIVSDIGADAVKTGMLSTSDIISAVAESIRRLGLRNVVVDPVMVAESGAMLLHPDAVETLIYELFPLADVITPNIHEAFALINEEVDEGRISECAVKLKDLGPAAVIITGGHTSSGSDLLYTGEDFVEIEGPLYTSNTTHGAGCTHSSALASFLALDMGLEKSAWRARSVAAEAVRYGLEEVGAGAGPVHSLGPLLKGLKR